MIKKIRKEAIEQDEMLADLDIHATLAQGESASRSLVDARTNSTNGDNDQPPGYTDGASANGYPRDIKDPALFERPSSGTASPTSSGPSAGPSRLQKKAGLSKGLASLSESFRAMTAPFRYKPEPLVVALCEASARGNVNHISSLLGEGANVDGRDMDGKTPLVRAIEAQEYDAVVTLLDRGASKGVADSAKKMPPLFWAADVGDLRIATLLLSRGCSPRDRSVYGRPYFVDTCANAPIEMVRLMLDHGADVSTKDAYGKEVVVHAVEKANLPLVLLLLERGASPAARNTSGTPIVVLALQDYEKRKDIFHLLVERGADVNSKAGTGGPMVVTALQDYDKNPEVFRLLIERGADVNSTSISGTPMVIEALKSGRIDLVGFLLSRGANPNTHDVMGTSMILIIIKDLKLNPVERMAIIKTLLEYGADPNTVDSWGWTAMDYILDKGLSEFIPLFLQRGADPNKKVSTTGLTLLMHAIDTSNWDLALQLLKYGANPNVADAKGRTPLLETLRRREFATTKMLIDHGADLNKEGMITPLAFAKASNQDDVVRLLISRGVIPEADITPPPPRPILSPVVPSSSASRASPSPSGRVPQQARDRGEQPPDYESSVKP